jgi:hypothetical protein
MTYKDNQPTFNVGNRKVVNFKDYLQNKDAEKAKLTKADLQSKPNSEDQQHLGNTRTEYNPVTHKLTDYSVDEIEDTLDAMEEETNEGVFSDEGHAGMNGERYIDEKSYNEEEVLELLVKMNEWPTTFDGEDEVREWFEEFKK